MAIPFVAVPRAIEFNGVVYKLLGKGRYYLSQSNTNRGRRGAKSLHVAIWEFHHQRPVPPRHEVHHRDGDPFNNDIPNLECLSIREHRRRHAESQRTPRQLAHLAVVRPLAAEWHRTEAGREWHSSNAKSSWERREPREFVCESCGERFAAYRPDARFCSTRCNQRHQRATKPKEYERRDCVVCGTPFDALVRPHRDRMAITCGRSCRRRKPGSLVPGLQPHC